MNEAVSKGYLFEDFRLFHLNDRLAQSVEPHYHEFDKFVMVCAGSVDYTVEGVSNRMQPGDMLFVRHHDIHRPEISPDSAYERYVLWITPGYLERCGTQSADLGTCFALCSQRRSFMLRPGTEQERRVRKDLTELESALHDREFGSEILADACFRRLLVTLNRCVLTGPEHPPRDVDPKIDEVLRYINGNLAEDLSVEALAARSFLSRYYFMRRFKEATGYTVHSYIQQKRLALAAEKLDGGLSVTAAAMESGFPEYSVFLRTFRKAFGMTPSEYLRRQRTMDSSYRE